ncbi:major facilitator superfamily domain-containing protein [Ilyonectria destructans]|nr:major facilitator superfamily domain-containing protein [Ilyonectria destructans]
MAPTLYHDGSTPPKETVSEVQTGLATDSPDSNAPFGDGAENETDSPSTEKAKKPAFNRDWRFWMIMVTLVISTLLSSLESTVVITSLPTIVADLKIGSDYIWITNVYFLTSACLQPLFGQLCNLFGRRNVMVSIFAIYTLGSGLCGGANGAAMLIAGRAIQGIGAGGVAVAGDVIMSDLVPLRYRGNYIAMLLLVATVGFAVGPFIGGLIVERTTWRWIFYLNLPLGGVGMVIAHMFLNLQWDREESTMSKLRRIDYGGNAILFAASVSILIALTWAGPIYPWADARILVPLFLGVAGLVGFVLYEGSGIPIDPVMPIRLFPHRTARIIYFQTFLNSVLLMWCYYFLPLYFQGVMVSSPSRSGVQMLPVALIAIPGAAVSSLMLSKWGKYKLLHMTGFLLLSLGGGMLALLSEDSSDAAWILIQFLPAIGSGFLLSTMLPAFQASTEEIDQAAATGTWSFIRTFGMVWGVAVAGTIFNTYTKQYAHQIDNEMAREHLSSGDAYASATRDFLLQFEQPVRDQIRHVFMLSLRKVYAISTAFGGVAFFLCIFEKDVPLRKELETQYGLEEREKDKEQV